MEELVGLLIGFIVLALIATVFLWGGLTLVLGTSVSLAGCFLLSVFALGLANVAAGRR